jgi:hypothetical protein
VYYRPTNTPTTVYSFDAEFTTATGRIRSFLGHTTAINQVLSELKNYASSKAYRREKHTDGIPQFIQLTNTYQNYISADPCSIQCIDQAHLNAEKIEAAQKLLLNFTNGSVALKFDALSMT